jgi:acetate kinase
MSLDRLDALVSTGGVAEHQPSLLGELIAGQPIRGLRAALAQLARSGDGLSAPRIPSSRY